MQCIISSKAYIVSVNIHILLFSAFRWHVDMVVKKQFLQGLLNLAFMSVLFIFYLEHAVISCN